MTAQAAAFGSTRASTVSRCDKSGFSTREDQAVLEQPHDVTHTARRQLHTSNTKLQHPNKVTDQKCIREKLQSFSAKTTKLEHEVHSGQQKSDATDNDNQRCLDQDLTREQFRISSVQTNPSSTREKIKLQCLKETKVSIAKTNATWLQSQVEPVGSKPGGTSVGFVGKVNGELWLLKLGMDNTHGHKPTASILTKSVAVKGIVTDAIKEMVAAAAFKVRIKKYACVTSNRLWSS